MFLVENEGAPVPDEEVLVFWTPTEEGVGCADQNIVSASEIDHMQFSRAEVLEMIRGVEQIVAPE